MDKAHNLFHILLKMDLSHTQTVFYVARLTEENKERERERERESYYTTPVPLLTNLGLNSIQ